MRDKTNESQKHVADAEQFGRFLISAVEYLYSCFDRFIWRAPIDDSSSGHNDVHPYWAGHNSFMSAEYHNGFHSCWSGDLRSGEHHFLHIALAELLKLQASKLCDIESVFGTNSAWRDPVLHSYETNVERRTRQDVYCFKLVMFTLAFSELSTLRVGPEVDPNGKVFWLAEFRPGAGVGLIEPNHKEVVALKYIGRYQFILNGICINTADVLLDCLLSARRPCAAYSPDDLVL